MCHWEIFRDRCNRYTRVAISVAVRYCKASCRSTYTVGFAIRYIGLSSRLRNFGFLQHRILYKRASANAPYWRTLATCTTRLTTLTKTSQTATATWEPILERSPPPIQPLSAIQHPAEQTCRIGQYTTSSALARASIRALTYGAMNK